MNRSARNRKRRRHTEKTRVNLSPVLVIMVMAVALGFFTTKCIIYPLVLGEDAKIGFSITKLLSPSDKKETNKEGVVGQSVSDGAIDSTNITNNTAAAINGGDGGQNTAATSSAITDSASTVTGYCIQFGSFTTRDAAQELVSQLSTSGINAAILEKDGAFKVIGDLFKTKEAAVEAKNKIMAQQYNDAFITFI